MNEVGLFPKGQDRMLRACHFHAALHWDGEGMMGTREWSRETLEVQKNTPTYSTSVVQNDSWKQQKAVFGKKNPPLTILIRMA